MNASAVRSSNCGVFTANSVTARKAARTVPLALSVRKSGYELLQALLTIIFAGGIECVGQAIRPKKNHVTVVHRYRLSLVRRISLHPQRHARGCGSVMTPGPT